MKLSLNLDKPIAIARQAARAAGEFQRTSFEKKQHIIRKAERELVSQVDMTSQQIIEDVLMREEPGWPIFTEEKNDHGNYPLSDFFWIVDPLDGTHNYIAGLPHFGVSIALIHDGRLKAGVIYLPAFDQMFWATDGGGAFCEDVRLKVSDNSCLSKSMMTYDNQFYADQEAFSRYRRCVETAFTTRITGCAVYDLCMISSGKIDARVWNHTKICDVAAGTLLVRESGGQVTDFQGDEILLDVKDALASNSAVHDQLLEILKD